MGTLVLTEPRTRLNVDGERFAIERAGKAVRRVRIRDTERVLLFGSIEVTHACIGLCPRMGVDVVFLTVNGRYRGRLQGRLAKNVRLRIEQLRASTDPERTAAVARSIVTGKIQNQRAVLLRAQETIRDERVAGALAQLRHLAGRAAAADDVDTIRGYEGSAAAAYFGVFGLLIKNDAFRFERRRRRPPPDPINACLSFGYTMLGVTAEDHALTLGLDPHLGFLHRPAHGRPSLVLDVIEEFRPLIVDRLVLSLINRRQLGPRDFGHPEVEPGDDGSIELEATPPLEDQNEPTEPPPEERHELPPIYLNETGRRIFLSAFFGRMRSVEYYAPRDMKLETSAIVQAQFQAMARVIQSVDAEYRPFTSR